MVKGRKQLTDDSTESYSHICKENNKLLTMIVGNGLFPFPPVWWAVTMVTLLIQAQQSFSTL